MNCNDTPRHINATFESRHFSHKTDWTHYANWLRRHTRVAMGIYPEPKRTPLKSRVFDRWQGDDYTCEKICFESLPGFYVTGNLYRPLKKNLKRKRQKHPAVLCPHGHTPDGRLHDWDDLCSEPARCVKLAQLGIIAFSYDMVGYNDSCQLIHRQTPSDPLWGFSMMALQTWNSTRAVDFLQSLPDVDNKRIGITGMSGGGTQSFILAAVDDRIAVSAPIVMVSNIMQGGCVCENHPLLRLDSTNVDLCRLFAPKPQFIGSCLGDWTRNVPHSELPAIREIYQFHHAEKKITGFQNNVVHNYNQQMREHVYGFFNKHLLGANDDHPVSEWAWQPIKPTLRERMIWWGQLAPEKMPPEQIHTLWRNHVRSALRTHLTSVESVRKTLVPLLPHVMGVTPNNIEQAQHDQPIGITAQQDDKQLTICSTGKIKHDPNATDYYTTYNRSPFADRVHEILGAIERSKHPVELIGRGDAGLCCLFAAALSKRVRRIEIDTQRFNPNNDAHWDKHLNTPAIRQYACLESALAALGKCKLVLRQASPAMTKLAKRYTAIR